MITQTVSIQRIFNNLGRFIDRHHVSETDVIDWTAKALDAMKLHTVFQPAVAIRTVSNYQTTMPRFLHAIVQIARNNKWVDETTVTTDNEEDTTESELDIPVALDQYGMPVNAYDLAYYRPFPDMGEYFTVGQLQIKKYQFTPVRLANHSFFNSLVCKETDFDGIYATCNDEYTIVENLLRFSFESGQVMISYLKQQLDENGYPMIPDDFSAIEAIENYIKMQVFEEQVELGRQGAEGRLANAKSDWHWYCGQAMNADKLPQTVDEWQNFADMHNRLIPKRNRYYGFFGAMSHPEKLKF